MAIDLDDYDCSAGRAKSAKPAAKPGGKQNQNGGKKGKGSKGGGNKGGKGNGGGGGGGKNGGGKNGGGKGGSGGGDKPSGGGSDKPSGGRPNKGGGKGKPAQGGGSVLAHQFKADLEKKHLQARRDHHLGGVSVSSENKHLVLDVLKNIRDDVHEEVKGLSSVAQPAGKVAKFEFVDGQIAREVDALVRRGVSKDISKALVEATPGSTTDDRLWTAVRASMEEVAADRGGALHDGEDWAEEDLDAARAEEREGLGMILEESMLDEDADGTLSISLSHLALHEHHRQYATSITLVLRDVGPGSQYPSEAPMALLFAAGETQNTEFARSVNTFIWAKLTTELTGQPALYSLITELEVEIPERLARCYPIPKAAPKERGGKGRKGRNGKGGRQQPVPAGNKADQPSAQHASLIDSIITEQAEEGAGGKALKVPQLFPELSTFEVRTQAVGQAKEPDSSKAKAKWPGIEKDAAADERLRVQYERRISTKAGLPEQRSRLPASKQEEEILSIVRENQVTLITGETGCGKTTQVPQFILDEMLRDGRGSECRMVCTQPRRIAATSIAKRVAQERGDPLGSQVGYSIRLETKQSRDTRLLFCTTGVLLRRLQASSALEDVSHVFVDEVHERSLDSDFLLIFLKELTQRRPDIKIVLMSASVNATLFSEYFDNCPVCHIPGFTHPVQVLHAEDLVTMTKYVLEDDSKYSNSGGRRRGGGGGGDIDEFSSKSDVNQALKASAKKDKQAEYLRSNVKGIPESTIATLSRMNDDTVNNELVVETLYAICFGKFASEPGAVLVFLPGLQEINMLYEDINGDRRLSQAVECHRLHSSVTNQEQEAVFNPPRSKAKRKVVLSTNIAETSVTIDDIVFVLDAGKHKENRYAAQQGMNRLVSRWVSRANAQQRKGRAGRVRPGYCLRLYSSYTHNEVMASFQECEMTRVPLQNLLLQIRVLNFGEATDTEVLGRAIEAPRDSSVKACRDSLTSIGAIGPNSGLTSLGLHLANLPLDPKLGKLLLHGVLLRCVDPCLTIAAALQNKPPFVSPYDKKVEADLAKAAAAKKTRSDHLATLNAYNAWLVMKDEAGSDWRRKEREHAQRHFVSAATLSQIQQTKRQLWQLLQGMGIVGATADDARGVVKAADQEGEPRIFELGGKELNQFSTMRQSVKASLVAAFTPSVVRIKYSGNKKNPRPFLNEQHGDVNIHPSSVCGMENQFPHPLLVYYEKVCRLVHTLSPSLPHTPNTQVQTTKVYLRDVTMVTPVMLMMFAVDVEYQDGVVLINKWISFHMDVEV